MDVETIERRRREIIARSGPWTAHNFLLAPGVYTMGSEDPQPVPGYPIGGAPDELKLRRVLQIVSDLSRKSIEDLRVLDLGCLEGLYCVEFAARGAQVVGVEGRAENVEKARFALEALGLTNAEVAEDDVRNLSPERFGHYDVVLCLGLLYHLDSPDVFQLLESMAAVCDGLTIIDTHVNDAPVDRRRYREVEYWGEVADDHPVGQSGDDELSPLWQGIGTRTNFRLTRSSLVNAIRSAGFSSAYECYLPPERRKERDRVTLVALRGERDHLRSTPRVNSLDWEDMPEATSGGIAALRARAKGAVPPALRHRLRRRARRARRRVKARLGPGRFSTRRS